MIAKTAGFTRIMLMLAALAPQGQAATRYVNVDNASPSAPYTSWATAATSIQPAVDAAASGDTVLVDDGSYELTAPILVSKNITIISANSAAATIIDGKNQTRCFELRSPCVLNRLTITKGYASNGSGGGIYCDDTSSIVANCIVEANRARTSGGGMNNGTANNCTFKQNSADSPGGGMSGGIANNCTFFKNATAADGGGMAVGTANDCLFDQNYATRVGGGIYRGMANRCTFSYNNSGSHGGGLFEAVANYCTIDNNRSNSSGGGVYGGTANYCSIKWNRAYDQGGGMREGSANNCIFWNNSVDTGSGGGLYNTSANNCTIVANRAYEQGGGMFSGTARNCIVWANSAYNSTTTSNLATTVASYTCTDGFYTGTGNIDADPMLKGKSYGNFYLLEGSPCINTGYNSAAVGTTDFLGRPRIIENRVDIGAFEYLPTTQYVASSGAHDYPFSSWATAATNIQAAVDVTYNGHSVTITNGTYLLTAEIVVTNAITIESVNGPTATIIDGNYAVRCFNLGSSACVISGLTIQNGSPGEYENGGGILCNSATPVVTNCVLNFNFGNLGGGMYRGTANHCTFTGNYGNNGGGLMEANADSCFFSGNSASVGGAMVWGIANDCMITNNYASAYGGGIYGSTANRCTIIRNRSGNRGGGMDSGTANNCLILNNTASYGGGLYVSTANNCTIRGNSAYEDGGGTYESSLKNCIVWYNSAFAGNDIWLDDPEYSYGSSSYTCSPDVTHNQSGNTTATPLFIDNYRPAFNSPTLNIGNNSGVAATDFDDRPRMVNGTVDMGAFEYNADFSDSNSDGIPDSWGLQYFGSATGGLASANGDTDSFDNGNEYIAGTDPTNGASFFRVTSQDAAPGGFVINWDTAPGRVYTVRWTDSLTNSFQSLESGIPYPQNSYTDTVHTAEANSFYELEVARAE